MFDIFKPFAKNLANKGVYNILFNFRSQIILVAFVLLALIFALLFLNVTIYLLLSTQIGVIYASLVVFLLWFISAIAGIIWVKNKFRNLKEKTSNSLTDVVKQNKEIIMPIAGRALPLAGKVVGKALPIAGRAVPFLLNKRHIVQAVSAVILGGAAGMASKFFRRRH